MYLSNSARQEWNDSRVESGSGNPFKARLGSSLAVTMTGGVRLFYQDGNGVLKRIKEVEDDWSSSELVPFHRNEALEFQMLMFGSAREVERTYYR